MSLILKEGNTFETLAAGRYLVQLLSIKDIGEQVIKVFNNGVLEEKKQKQIMFVFEAKTENKKPYIHTTFFTASLNKSANLRKFSLQMSGNKITENQFKEGIDISLFEGRYFYAEFLVNEKGYAKIEYITPTQDTFDANYNVGYIPDWAVIKYQIPSDEELFAHKVIEKEEERQKEVFEQKAQGQVFSDPSEMPF